MAPRKVSARSRIAIRIVSPNVGWPRCSARSKRLLREFGREQSASAYLHIQRIVLQWVGQFRWCNEASGARNACTVASSFDLDARLGNDADPLLGLLGKYGCEFLG